MTLRRKLTTTIIAILAWAAPAAAQANLPDRNYWRWFEVEVLLFKHAVEQQLYEQFPLAVEPIPTAAAEDLLSPYFKHKIHPLQFSLRQCDSWPTLGEFNTYQLAIDCYVNDVSDWIPIANNPLAPESALAALEQTPVVIDGNGGNIKTATQAFLMPKSVHVLTETRAELERKGLAEPLLHVAWRQPVFNESTNYAMRLFAGQQFSKEFYYDGYPRQTVSLAARAPNKSLTERVNQLLQLVENGQLRFTVDKEQLPPRLAQQKQPDYVWQLDGLLHIFLIGNYLHIDNEFNLREVDMVDFSPSGLAQQAEYALSQQSTQQPYLRAYHFDQRRRVISHETHYFDHPKVGMVIQIRRTDLSAPRY